MGSSWKIHLIFIIILILILGPLFSFGAAYFIIGPTPSDPNFILFFLFWLPFGFLLAIILSPLLYFFTAHYYGLE